MSFLDLLIHTCDIERFAVTGTDAYGNPVKAWTKTYTNEPCRFGPQTGAMVWTGTMNETVDFKVFLPELDITEEDRILWHHDEKYYKVLIVDHVADSTVNHHHREVSVRIIRPSGNI